MRDRRSEDLRRHIAERVGEELKRQIGDDHDVPDFEKRRIVEEVFGAGNEEIEYGVRRLVRRTRKNLARIAKEERHRTEKVQAIPRFSLSFRVQHMAMAASVLTLIVTGIPIKFHQTSWIGDVVRTLHLVDSMKITHRIAAAVMASAGVYHVFWTVFTREGWRNFVALLPRTRDLTDCIRMVMILAGRRREKPRFGRFNFIEKFDYWAVYWGVVIMLGTGMLLAFNTYFMNALGPYSLHIAKLIHSDEALLATLALLLWHFYWAHFNPEKFPMNKTFLTGTMTVQEMVHEHPAELEERVRSGEIPRRALEQFPEWLAMHPASRTEDAGGETKGDSRS